METRYISWGVGIQDLDNDGLADVLWVTGGIYPELQNASRASHTAFPGFYSGIWGEGVLKNSFRGQVPESNSHCSRGCAFGDFDNDGDMDVLIMNLNEPPSLLRNDLQGSGHWIKVKLTRSQSNRSAIGARVTVHYGDRTQAQEVIAQSSYLSVNDRRLHFGLGPIESVAIEIRWPTGAIERIGDTPADRLIEVTEGSGITRVQRFNTSK